MERALSYLRQEWIEEPSTQVTAADSHTALEQQGADDKSGRWLPRRGVPVRVATDEDLARAEPSEGESERREH